MSAAVGADVEDICSLCGDMWHVVVAEDGDRIERVQCKQCSREHRPKSSKPAPRSTRSAARPGSKSVASVTSAAAPLVAADLSKPVEPYKPTGAFGVGQRLLHPTFGAGVVESSPGPGKIQVFFPGGRRILAQAKPGGQLPGRSTENGG